MYIYDQIDHEIVQTRVAEFRDQVARRLSGELTEEEFKPLRLMNGLYHQLHAYMLRVAIPYGTLNSNQMRRLAHIARTYDKGYGHFTTRQNIQYNWPKLEDTPKILEELAEVEMHAIQTSGNCIRNTTTDHFAGAAADEIEDGRIWCEIIRQWSSLHPEFAFLPRKFKIAVTGSPTDRAAIKVHDIGLRLHYNDAGEMGFEVVVGGGQGRSPFVAKTIREFLPVNDVLSYLEAILRIYNLEGRRDNKYKARVKILVHEKGIDYMREKVEEEFARIRNGDLNVPQEMVDNIRTHFTPPAFEALEDNGPVYTARYEGDKGFAAWINTNIAPHQKSGYASVTISLKPIGGIPGDATDAQMDVMADLAEQYSFDDLRVTHEQNIVLPHVKQEDLPAVYDVLAKHGLETANAGLVSDMIACPGLDYCALANARSIPVAQRISEKFEDLDRQHNIGELKLKISGCINACGHHHVGHIGILGVDKKGEEFFQISLGGRADEHAAIGKITGPGFSEEEIPDAIERLVNTYIRLRQDDERFIDTYSRVGMTPFKEDLYAPH